MRKFLITLISFLAILLLAFFGWYFMSGGNGPAPVIESLKNVLPFGSNGNDSDFTATPDTVASSTVAETEVKPLEDLFNLSNTPVAGSVVFTRNKLEVVRYVERATGHIFEIVLPSSATSTDIIVKNRITNKTLPKIYEAYFRSDGSAVLLRSLKNNSDTSENLSLTLTPPNPKASSTDGLHTVSATVLRGDIDSVVTGFGNTLIYSLKNSGAILSSSFNTLTTQTLLNSPFSNWRLSTAGDSLLVYTKASSQAPGYAYRLSGSGLSKVLGPLNGLVALTNLSGTRTLYSYIDRNETKLAAITNLGTVTEISPATIAEKCVWSVKRTSVVICGAPTNSLSTSEPDNWYKGLSHFSDEIWRFNTDSQIAQILMQPKDKFGVDLDVMQPKLSPAEDYLIFTNKNDLSLWALKLEPF